MPILALIIGLIPGFIWLRFYLREDIHPEPRGLIAYTFIGGIGAALVALLIETPIHKNFLPAIGFSDTGLLALILVSIIEEVLKFGGAYFCIHKNHEFNEPVDAMEYTVAAALGFATLENIGAAMGVATGQAAAIHTIFAITSARFIGATLLHSLTSGIVGYFWAKDIRDFFERRQLVIGLTIAIVLHTVFNYLILHYGNIAYIIMFLSIVGFFVLGDFEKLRRRAV